MDTKNSQLKNHKLLISLGKIVCKGRETAPERDKMKKLKLQSITDYKVMCIKDAMDALGFTYVEDKENSRFDNICCCGEPVECSGFFGGTERIECNKCGKYILDLFSPIQNSNSTCSIISVNDYEVEDGNKFWIAIDGKGGIKVSQTEVVK